MDKRRRSFWRVILICFVAFALCGCDIMWSRYTDKKKQFSISFPLFWVKQKNKYNAAVIALEPVISKSDTFSENCNVIVTDLEREVQLGEFYEFTREELTRQLLVYDTLEGETFAGLMPGRWISFVSKYQGNNLHIISAMFVKGKRAYTVTCTSQQDRYPKYEPLFMKIIRSLRVK